MMPMSIIIIDNYIDYSILKYLSKKKKDVNTFDNK